MKKRWVCYGNRVAFLALTGTLLAALGGCPGPLPETETPFRIELLATQVQARRGEVVGLPLRVIHLVQPGPDIPIGFWFTLADGFDASFLLANAGLSFGSYSGTQPTEYAHPLAISAQ
ncbi:MAG: hypothetical protein NZ651_06800, partial [Candidatus Bipolaricaulota bacterium]|nr:hypothetical protein [Candidatus Bipolaricaulota bacterium]MDW8127463.1 hypothetical protein [Candidatus Bipolaricaulota bacterium]